MIKLSDIVYHDRIGQGYWIVESITTNFTPYYEKLKIRELVKGQWDDKSRYLLICRRASVKDHLRIDDLKVKGNINTDNLNTLFHVKH